MYREKEDFPSDDEKRVTTHTSESDVEVGCQPQSQQKKSIPQEDRHSTTVDNNQGNNQNNQTTNELTN